MQVIAEALVVAVAVMGISVLIVAPESGPVAGLRDAVIRWAWDRTSRPFRGAGLTGGQVSGGIGEWVEEALSCPPCVSVWVSLIAVPAVWSATGNWWLLASPGVAVFGLYLWRDLRGRPWRGRGRSERFEPEEGGKEVEL